MNEEHNSSDVINESGPRKTAIFTFFTLQSYKFTW